MSRYLLRARLNFVEAGGVAGGGQVAWIIRSSQRCERQGGRSARDCLPTTAKVGRKE